MVNIHIDVLPGRFVNFIIEKYPNVRRNGINKRSHVCIYIYDRTQLRRVPSHKI